MTRTLFRSSKVIIALIVVAAMAFSMAPVFAASPGDYEGNLYKDGQFNPADRSLNKSMGDGAFLDADASYDNVNDETTLIVYVTGMPLGSLTGYVTDLEFNGQAGVPSGTIGSTSYPSAFTFNFAGKLSGTVLFDVVPAVDIVDSNEEVAGHMDVVADYAVFDLAL